MILPDPVAVTGVAGLPVAVLPGIAGGPEAAIAEVFADVFRDASAELPYSAGAGRSFGDAADVSMPEVGVIAADPDRAGPILCHVPAVGLADFAARAIVIRTQDPGTEPLGPTREDAMPSPTDIAVDWEPTRHIDPIAAPETPQFGLILPADARVSVAGPTVAAASAGPRSVLSPPVSDTPQTSRDRLPTGPAPIIAPADLPAVGTPMHIRDSAQIDPPPDTQRSIRSTANDTSVHLPDQLETGLKQGGPMQPVWVKDAGLMARRDVVPAPGPGPAPPEQSAPTKPARHRGAPDRPAGRDVAVPIVGQSGDGGPSAPRAQCGTRVPTDRTTGIGRSGTDAHPKTDPRRNDPIRADARARCTCGGYP